MEVCEKDQISRLFAKLRARDTQSGTYREEEIANVVRDVHGDPHVRKVEAIAQPDERERDDMMQHELLEVLPRLLQLQHQYNRLLRPVRSLQQVVRLEESVVRAVREALVHACRVEVPDWRARHDVQAEGAEDGEVDGCVELFHEAGLLCAGFDSGGDRDGTDEALHEELAGKGQDYGVEGDEGEVLLALAVLSRVANVRRQGIGALVQRRVGIREVNRRIERVVLAGRDVVGCEQQK